MNFGIIFSISKKHLLTRKRQSIVAALGVTFGIGAYIILMSFMTGLNGLLDDLILNRTPHIHIFNEVSSNPNQPIDVANDSDESMIVVHSVKPRQETSRVHNALAIISELNKRSDVLKATAMVQANAFYLGGATKLNGALMGINVQDEVDYYNLSNYVTDGQALDLKKTQNGILIGKGVADKLSLNKGDLVQVANTRGDIYSLKIVGFFQSGLAQVDDVQSYVNIKTAQRILGESSNFITDINVKLLDMAKAPDVGRQLEREYGVHAVDIQTANAQFDTGSEIRSLISYAVSFTLLLVAGFGIYNILNMMIYEKLNDIAILRATGFSSSDVRWIFLNQALMIGIVGGILGLLIGLFVSYLISIAPFETTAMPTVKTFPVNFNPSYYSTGLIFALISTFMAGILPARKAGRIDPVDIIRGQ